VRRSIIDLLIGPTSLVVALVVPLLVWWTVDRSPATVLTDSGPAEFVAWPTSSEPPAIGMLEGLDLRRLQRAPAESTGTAPLVDAETVPRPNVRLVNLLVATDRALAVFDRAPDARRITVGRGERVDRAIVEEIRDDAVILLLDGRRFEYRLE